MSDFGSGAFLTNDLDFEVTSTGDLRVSSGLEELQKDLSFQSIVQLQEFSGARQSTRTKARIRSEVSRILTDDPRIDSIVSIQVRFVRRYNEAEVVVVIESDNTEQELVFGV